MNGLHTISLMPKWWQFIRRYQMWRMRKKAAAWYLGSPVTDENGTAIITKVNPK